MLIQLAIGTLVVIVNVIVQAEMYSAFAARFEAVILILRRIFKRFANTAAIVTGALFVMLVQTVNVWIWASVFYFVGAFSEFEPALYFSLVSFSTVGFGDITLSHDWRLLSGLTAAAGFLSFGWSTAYMVELVRRTA
jgi:Ion channel